MKVIDKIRSLFIPASVSQQVTNSRDYKKIIIDKLSILLKPLGYKRKGATYIHTTNDLTYYISLQSSQSSTAKQLKVTVNIEMSSARLAAFRDDRMQPAERNYRARIGFYSDKKCDKWWLINNINEAEAASEEIARLLLANVFPELELFKSTDDLIAYWEQGNMRGITEFQRKDYLALLKMDQI